MSESSAETLSFLGEISVQKVQIISLKGSTIDISGIVGEIALYEDIFSNTMSGHILIQDSNDLIASLPLVGEELLTIELQTPTLRKKISKTFYIYKLQSRIISKRSQIYKLNFCSQELIYSKNSKVSKAFTGKISDTVTSIFSDTRYLGSESLLYVEPTNNDCTFIAPYWSPFETINWLSAKSLNDKKVPNYLFFESNQSYEYVSVDTLISAESERDYFYSDVDAKTTYGSESPSDDMYRVVESISNDVTFDYLRNLSGGMYSSSLYTLDLTSKSISNNTFDYINDFDKSTHLNKSPIRSDYLMRKRLASIYHLSKNNYSSGVYKNQPYSDTFLQRNSLLEQLSAFKMNIKVPGRTDIKVGNVITFTIHGLRQLLEDELESTGKSDYFTGRYLITAIKHQIINNKHSMEMEIVMDSFVKPILTNIT